MIDICQSLRELKVQAACIGFFEKTQELVEEHLKSIRQLPAKTTWTVKFVIYDDYQWYDFSCSPFKVDRPRTHDEILREFRRTIMKRVVACLFELNDRCPIDLNLIIDYLYQFRAPIENEPVHVDNARQAIASLFADQLGRCFLPYEQVISEDNLNLAEKTNWNLSEPADFAAVCSSPIFKKMYIFLN